MDTGVPVARWSLPDLRGEVLSRRVVATVSGTTLWRWLAADAVRCPYQKLHPYPGDRPMGCPGRRRHGRENGTAKDMIFACHGGPVPAHNGRPAREDGQARRSAEANIKPRGVRSGDVNRRRVEQRRSRQTPAVGQPDGREHPCPARGECASRDSRRGSA